MLDRLGRPLLDRQYFIAREQRPRAAHAVFDKFMSG